MHIGVDEAGKGPVFGPMVATAVRAPPGALPADVDDSKRVAESRRKGIAAELRDREDVTVGVATVEPAEIDEPGTDMNTLTVLAQARAIADVVRAGDSLLLDAGDTSETRFARRVREALVECGALDGGEDDCAGDGSLEIVAEHGADETYPIVGAASIVAKVERDRRIAGIAAEHGDVGSGYPSDPTTREYLAGYVADHDDVPPFARRTWSTCTELLEANEQSALEDF